MATAKPKLPPRRRKKKSSETKFAIYRKHKGAKNFNFFVPLVFVIIIWGSVVNKKHLLCVAVLLLLAGCTGTPKHPAWTNATGAEQCERLMWQSIQNKQWHEVDHHLAPLFMGVNTAGQSLDHAAWIEHWKQAQVKDYSLGELSAQPAGTDVVVSYIVHFNDGAVGRIPPGSGVRVVSVWQSVKKGWVLISQTHTLIQ